MEEPQQEKQPVQEYTPEQIATERVVELKGDDYSPHDATTPILDMPGYDLHRTSGLLLRRNPETFELEKAGYRSEDGSYVFRRGFEPQTPEGSTNKE